MAWFGMAGHGLAWQGMGEVEEEEILWFWRKEEHLVRGFETIDESSFMLLLQDVRFSARQLYLAVSGLREEDAIQLLSNVLLDTLTQSAVLAQRKSKN
jgi:hypothetical protein